MDKITGSKFGLLLIGVAIFYYLVIYIPQQQKVKEEQKQAEKSEEIKERCITQTLKDLKDAHPLMETREITNFRKFNDRGCFLEAGCMGDVQYDENFKPLFQSCNNEYYQECLSGVEVEVIEMIESEKQKRIAECINLYQQSNF